MQEVMSMSLNGLVKATSYEERPPASSIEYHELFTGLQSI